jgi:uncharacterized RDD family membrane protein YckC
VALTCEKCGAEIPDGISVCRHCETPVSVAHLGPIYVPQTASSPEAGAQHPAISSLPVGLLFAGFWLRAVAYLIDGILSGIPLGIAAIINPPAFFRTLDPNVFLQSPFAALTPLAIGSALVTTWLYGAAFESSAWQATPGKRLLRIRVTDLGGHRVTFARALLRNVCKQISSFLFIGYIMAGFTAKKQGLHDLLSGCLVVKGTQ